MLLAANLFGANTLLAADPPPAAPAPPTTTPAPPPPGGTGEPGRPGGTDRRGGDRNVDRSVFQNRGQTVGLGLDEKQRELLREASQKDSDELRKLEEKLRAAQKELVHTVLAEKYDEKAVHEKVDAVSRLQVEITMLRAKTLSTVAPTLKPEQREQLENSPLAMSLLNAGGFGGFRGGGPGGPGGFGGTGGQDGGSRGGDRRRPTQPSQSPQPAQPPQ
jgi:Spy/CpxP family protein refolding chaperone